MDRDQTLRRLNSLQAARANMAALNRLNRRWLRGGFVNLAILLILLVLTLLLSGGIYPELTTVPEYFEPLLSPSVIGRARQALRILILLIVLVAAAGFAYLWIEARLSTHLALVGLLLVFIAGSLAGVLREPGRWCFLLAAFATATWLIQSLIWERVSAVSDYKPTVDLMEGLDEPLRGAVTITTLWRDPFDREVPRQTILTVSEGHISLYTRHPERAWTYAEMKLADLAAVRIDAGRRKVTLLSNYPTSYTAENLGWPALNDRWPQRSYKMSFFAAAPEDWQKVANLLEQQRGLPAEIDRELPSLLLRVEERGRAYYVGRSDDTDQVSSPPALRARSRTMTSQVRPYHDITQARLDLESVQEARPELESRLLDADSDWQRVPSIDMFHLRGARLAALVTGLLTLALSLLFRQLEALSLVLSSMLALLTLIQVLSAQHVRGWLPPALAALLPASLGVIAAMMTTLLS